MAKGTGQGQGSGRGSGETPGDDVAVGSAVAVVFTVAMCVCGVPMIIAGVILLQSEFLRTTGIAVLTISVVITATAIILIVLICTGYFSPKHDVHPTGGTMPAGPLIATSYTSRQMVVGGPMMGPGPPPYQQPGTAPPPYVLQDQPPLYLPPEHNLHSPYPPPNIYSAPPPVAGPS